MTQPYTSGDLPDNLLVLDWDRFRATVKALEEARRTLANQKSMEWWSAEMSKLIATAREEALEEAAKLVETKLNYPSMRLNGGASDTDGNLIRPLAAKIRALKKGTP